MLHSLSRSVFVLTLIAGAAAAPQSAAPQAGAAAVLIDFRAVTAEGEPVLDLKPADITLRVGNRAREIASLELVQVGGGRPAAPVAAPALPPPFSSNVRAPGGAVTAREVLIMIDDESISPGREEPIREALGKLIDGLSPADRVGVLSARPGKINVGFEQPRQEARSTALKFSGQGSPNETPVDFLCRSVLALQAIRAALNRFSPDAAPTFVYVSGALSGPNGEQVTKIGATSDLCQLRTRNFEEVGAAAQATGAAIYIVHVLDSSVSSQSRQDQQAGLDNLAGVTGGEMLRFSGSDTLARIARETSAYYVASFEPEAADRSGTRQRVELRVARDNVRVNARPHIVIAKGGTPGGKPLTPRDMVRVTTSFSDLPLRGAVYSSNNPDGKVRLVVLFDGAEARAALNAATVIAFDARGTSKAQWNAEKNDLAASPVRAALLVEPGTYRVRIAATDTSGRPGTVDIETRAELAAAGAMKTSALVLGVAPSGSFSPRLQFDAGDQQAIGYVEIYGVPKDAKLDVRFELAETDGGPAIATGPAQISGGPTEDARLAFGGFGIGTMEPGDLLMRAVVLLNDKPIGSVSRTLRKTK